MYIEELIYELPKGLIKWYEFDAGRKALYVTGGIEACEPLSDALKESGLSVDIRSVVSLEESTSDGRNQIKPAYDYIVLAGALERSHNPEGLLCTLRGMLSPKGRLLAGTDNRLGIRYFCGDRDVFTERSFDSIENYVRVDAADRERLGGRTYAKAELVQMLENAGFYQHRFYSVLPEIAKPQVLYAEDYLPEEELEVRIFPQYHYPDTVFLEEERLYTTLIQNGLFHTMANGYLIECPLDNCYANVRQITVSMERGRENAMFTIIRRDDTVEKRPVYEEGYTKLRCLIENTQDLQKHGVRMIDAELEEHSFVMPYVKGEPATEYFRKLLSKNTELFLKELDRFWELICHSSDPVPYEEVNWEQFEPNWEKRKADDPHRDKWRKIAFGTGEEKENLGIILKRGYIDLISLNCFLIDGDFVFYDQELYLENLPAKAILRRTIHLIYRGNTGLEAVYPQKKLQDRYHMNEYAELWDMFTNHFLDSLRNDTQLSGYYRAHRRDIGVVHSNRQRINYSVAEYERLFRDIFRGTENRQIYLFGSGNFTKKFLSQFAADYMIAGIIDNNPEKWKTEISGIPIYAPQHLSTLESGSYKVIICIKNYVPVLRQLQQMGVREIGVYDSNMNYPRKAKAAVLQTQAAGQTPKKYHVGYIAGVFDLFHVGHLNMFKRAKEQCDYLIVGVVNDESVMKKKKTTPYIPFEERIELVRSCRYVDEAVEIPTDYGNTDEAYRRYQFDVQFSGSDYVDNPVWQAKKLFLEKQGAEMVFFPYTQSTSSTKLKALIEKGLL